MTIELTVTCNICGTEFHREGDFDVEPVIQQVQAHMETHGS